MDIDYNISIDDVLAYNLYYASHSPQIQKILKRRKLLYVLVGVFSLLFGLLCLFIELVSSTKGDLIIYSIGLLVLGLFLSVYGLLLESMTRKNVTKEVIRRYSNGKDGVIGKHHVSITPDRMSDITEVAENNIRWDAIEQVVTTDQHLYFLRLSSSIAHIVPKKAFADDTAFNKFAETAKSYLQTASATPLKH